MLTHRLRLILTTLCRKSVLNAWDKVHEPGERLEAYTKMEQGPTEHFQDFLQKLTRAVELQVNRSRNEKIDNLLYSLRKCKPNMQKNTFAFKD